MGPAGTLIFDNRPWVRRSTRHDDAQAVFTRARVGDGPLGKAVLAPAAAPTVPNPGLMLLRASSGELQNGCIQLRQLRPTASRDLLGSGGPGSRARRRRDAGLMSTMMRDRPRRDIHHWMFDLECWPWLPAAPSRLKTKSREPIKQRDLHSPRCGLTSLKPSTSRSAEVD